MDDLRENVIEFIRDNKTATVTFCQGRYVSRILELAKRKPDECEITALNADGSIVAHIPVSWIKINPTLELSEERREKLAEQARHMNAIKNS